MIADKKIRGFLIFVTCMTLGLLSSACGGREQKENSALILPESIELQFMPVELTALVKSKVEQGWEQTNSVPFGSIEGDPVNLDVYKVSESEFCGYSYERVVLLTHKNQIYRYQDCFSSSIEDEREESFFKLNYKPSEAQNIVHGAVELAANGPGRMVYFYYDVKQGNWFGFEDWGFPQVTDLDGDGTDELINQFQGLHMSRPDVFIYRWNGNELTHSESLKSTLTVQNISFSSAKLDNQTIYMEFTSVMDNKSETYEGSYYSYKDGKLLRQIN